MWPKNIVPFKLTESIELDPKALETRRFTEPGRLEWFSQGFTNSAVFESLIYRTGDFSLLLFKRAEKILPPSVIRDETDKKVAEIEAVDSRKVGRKERLGIKEQVTDDLLPSAFVRHSVTPIWIVGEWLLIESSSHAKAESIVSALREAFPPFPSAIPSTELAPKSLMTDWLSAAEAGDMFNLDDDCEMADGNENGAVVSCKRMDLTADEISQHILAGKQATKLGLCWNDRICFVLTEDMQIKRIKWLDVLQEAASQDGDDRETLFEATATLIAGELHELIGDLVASLGGIVK